MHVSKVLKSALTEEQESSIHFISHVVGKLLRVLKLLYIWKVKGITAERTRQTNLISTQQAVIMYKCALLFLLQALFVAHGSSFKHQPPMQMFESIEVYNLLAGKNMMLDRVLTILLSIHIYSYDDHI